LEKKKTEDLEQLNPNQYFEHRSRRIQELRQTGQLNPYPHKFHTTIDFDPSAFHDKYASLKPGESSEKDEIRVGGRIITMRSAGNNLRFYDLKCGMFLDYVRFVLTTSRGSNDSSHVSSKPRFE
jgi:lysyl-tRNA synthetase, class II